MIPFVFYFDDTFLDGYKVTMRSLLFHNPWFNNPVIIYCPPGFKNKSKIECIKLYKRTTFIPVIPENYSHINMKTGKEYFRQMFWKIDMFRTEAEKMVYLDTDLVIIGDISGLLDLKGDIVMARRDGHFNSGVMVIDKKCMGEKVYQKMLHFKKDAYRIPDQDLINAFFKGRIVKMPAMYNRKRLEYKKWKKKECLIVHYQKSKPWDVPEKKDILPFSYWWRYKDLPVVDKIGVLGSGTDADRYKNFHHLFNKLYLINAKSLLMFDDFPENCFKNKEIVHIVQHIKDSSLGKYYDKLGIKKIQSTARKGSHFRVPKKYPWFPDLLPWFMRDLGYEDYNFQTSTGIFGIEYALLHDCPKEVYLFGFNFYKTGWYGGKTKDFKMDLINKTKDHFIELVKKFKHIQFKGASDFKIDAPNWENI